MFLSGPIPQEPESKAEPGTQEAEEVCPCKGMSKAGLHKREKSNCHTAAAKTSAHLLGGRELGWSFRVFPNQDKNIRLLCLSISQSQAVGYTWGKDINLGEVVPFDGWHFSEKDLERGVSHQQSWRLGKECLCSNERCGHSTSPYNMHNMWSPWHTVKSQLTGAILTTTRISY